LTQANKKRILAIAFISTLLVISTICSQATPVRAQMWSIQTVDSTGNVGTHTSLALDSNGNPHISYCDDGKADLKYASWTGSNWTIQTVDSTGNVGGSTSLALDSDGNPSICYHEMTNTALKLAKWNGTAWKIQTVDSGNVGASSSLSLDPNDYPHISYYGTANGSLNYAGWNGSTWDRQTVDSDGNVGSYSSIAVDSNCCPHISYNDGSDYHLRYAYWNGSTWDLQTADSSSFVGYYSSIALDPNGNPRIGYHDEREGSGLKFANWTGLEWTFAATDSVGPIGNNWDCSLALDSNGSAHISYYKMLSSPPSLRYAKWDGATWSVQTVDNAGDPGRYSSIALDSNGVPHISYFERTNGVLKYAVLMSAPTQTSAPTPSLTPTPSSTSTPPQTVSPSPSTTIKPTSTPLAEASYTLLYHFIFGFAIIVVVLGLLFYYLRHRRKKGTWLMATNKKKVLVIAFTSVLLFSVTLGLPFVNLAKANFVGVRPSIPIATFQSPALNKTYTVNEIPVIFDVDVGSGHGGTGRIEGYYFLDGTILGKVSGITHVSISDEMTKLSEGKHQLSVQVISTDIAGGATQNEQKVLFYVDTVGSFSLSPSPSMEPSPSPTPSPIPTPSPTLSPTLEPTTEPSSTLKQKTGFLGTNLPTEYGYALVAVLVMVAVAGLSLVYFKKLRK